MRVHRAVAVTAAIALNIVTVGFLGAATALATESTTPATVTVVHPGEMGYNGVSPDEMGYN